MLYCRHVAKALADHKYWELPLYKRIGLRLHVAVCFVCGRYHSEMLVLQQLAKTYRDQETEASEKEPTALTDDTRKRLQDLIKREL